MRFPLFENEFSAPFGVIPFEFIRTSLGPLLLIVSLSSPPGNMLVFECNLPIEVPFICKVGEKSGRIRGDSK